MGYLMDLYKELTIKLKLSNVFLMDSNFKAKILLVFSIFTPTEAIKKPKYSKEERQDILTKKKTIKLKRKNRKKAILLNIA